MDDSMTRRTRRSDYHDDHQSTASSRKSVKSSLAAKPKSLFERLPPRIKIVCTNALCILSFLAYAFFGGCVLLYLEYDNAQNTHRENLRQRFECVVQMLSASSEEISMELSLHDEADISKTRPIADAIARTCLVAAAQPDAAQHEWNLKSAFLFGFGLLTTLGYGKVIPYTTSSRMFAVAWGLLGVPFAVIILSNLGLYLRFVERFLRKHIRKCSATSAGVESPNMLAENRAMDTSASLSAPHVESVSMRSASRLSVRSNGGGTLAASVKPEWNILPISLALFVLLHLTLGAIFLPLLNTSKFDFLNGFYYCYICFTGMEYGALVNHENSYFPVVLIYNCVGLAMSTIVLNVSSMYAKKLYYCSRRVGDFAQAKIWIGSKHLRVKELLSALSQTIGVDPDAFQQLDLDQMIEDAIMVKEGRLACVPQAYTFLEGIWPPELVPLFLRDGCLPDYVDADDAVPKSAQTNDKKSSRMVDRATTHLTDEETNALQAAIALSTFANGCLHRTLCPTTPATAESHAAEAKSLEKSQKTIKHMPTKRATKSKYCVEI